MQNVEFAAATLRSSSERLQGRISTGPLRICFCLRIIKSVGLHVPNDPSRYSSRVCNKCARNMRNLGHIYGEVKSSLEEQNNNLSTPNKENVAPTKRLLNTPHRNSPCRKAVNSPASKLPSRKSLSFARREITDEERLDAALHVENLPDEGDLSLPSSRTAISSQEFRATCQDNC